MVDVELRFVSPQLSELDSLESEVLACTVWEDVRPSDGVAGLCDWRTAGRIASLQRDGYLVGRQGEVLLLPGRPKLPFEKLLLFGAGTREAFDEQVCGEVTRHMLSTIDGLQANFAVAELPGRQSDLITPERAADLLLEAAGRTHQQAIWTLVEDGEARRQITQHMIEERRRVRRAL
ncbi:MAG: leucyl aminopeptidase [Deltaproteobacteria bacterium]|jgi:hypothetical protein|nr:leucyl aminopeptidase [Deltaproteobacteria bacterium]MBW2532547.1 leucyl aminopeptidase [Deltaproteobacteria bacterium]